MVYWKAWQPMKKNTTTDTARAESSQEKKRLIKPSSALASITKKRLKSREDAIVVYL